MQNPDKSPTTVSLKVWIEQVSNILKAHHKCISSLLSTTTQLQEVVKEQELITSTCGTVSLDLPLDVYLSDF